MGRGGNIPKEPRGSGPLGSSFTPKILAARNFQSKIKMTEKLDRRFRSHCAAAPRGNPSNFDSLNCLVFWKTELIVKIETACAVCGKTFAYDHLGRGRRRRFCSDGCRRLRQAEQHRRSRQAHSGQPRRYTPPAKKFPKTCIVCGAGFLAVSERRQACGLACGAILAKRHGDVGRRRNAEARRRRRCETCGVEFVARNPSGAARAGMIREGRFCSRTCFLTRSRPQCEPA